jgi:hypothetical protein
VAKAPGSEKHLPSCAHAQWPHCVCLKTHYHGAYVEANGQKTGKDFDEQARGQDLLQILV